MRELPLSWHQTRAWRADPARARRPGRPYPLDTATLRSNAGCESSPTSDDSPKAGLLLRRPTPTWALQRTTPMLGRSTPRSTCEAQCLRCVTAARARMAEYCRHPGVPTKWKLEEAQRWTPPVDVLQHSMLGGGAGSRLRSRRASPPAGLRSECSLCWEHCTRCEQRKPYCNAPGRYRAAGGFHAEATAALTSAAPPSAVRMPSAA